MSVLALLFLLVLIGCALGAVQKYAPMSQFWKHAVTAIAVVLTVAWLLDVFGLWGAAGHVGPIRRG